MIAEHDRLGSGEPLLLIHGFTAVHRTWGPVVPMLAEDFDVFAPTLPGHTGGPPLPDGDPAEGLISGLERMLDELGWQDAHIAGFSLGGWLGFELALRGRARTVTGIAPAGARPLHVGRESQRIARSFRRQHAAARRAVPQLERIARYPRMRKVAMRDMMRHGDRMTPDEFTDSVRSFAATPAFERYLSQETHGIEDLEGVECPVRIVWGVDDRILRVKYAAWYQERLPQARLRLLADAGHVPFWDQPHAIAREIRIGTGQLEPAATAAR